jgi:hypothetical protein
VPRGGGRLRGSPLSHGNEIFPGLGAVQKNEFRTRGWKKKKFFRVRAGSGVRLGGPPFDVGGPWVPVPSVWGSGCLRRPRSGPPADRGPPPAVGPAVGGYLAGDETVSEGVDSGSPGMSFRIFEFDSRFRAGRRSGSGAGPLPASWSGSLFVAMYRLFDYSMSVVLRQPALGDSVPSQPVACQAHEGGVALMRRNEFGRRGCAFGGTQ